MYLPLKSVRWGLEQTHGSTNHQQSQHYNEVAEKNKQTEITYNSHKLKAMDESLDSK